MYMDQKVSAAMLAIVDTGKEAHKWGIHPGSETQGKRH